MSIVVASCALTHSQSFWASDRAAELKTALLRHDFDQAQSIIDRYANALSANSALELGIREGDADVVRHFLPMADANLINDRDGQTPLINAVRHTPQLDKEAVVRLLLEAGAKSDVRDAFGRNAIEYASIQGDPALADFLSTNGLSYYSGRPASRVEWLPEITWQGESRKSVKRRKARRNRSLARRSPLKKARSGKPNLLFASAWIPELGGADAGPFTGLRFHSDGTGEVMRFFPQDKRMEPQGSSSLVWDFHRDHLYFAVLTRDFAAYCQSVAGEAGRFGVKCVDYAASGGNVPAALDFELSNASAKTFLNSASVRARLEQVGETNSVLKTATGTVCKPGRASSKLRRGLAKNASSSRKKGDWVVFDIRRYAAYGSQKSRVCTQRQARRVAFSRCLRAGGRCISVGGCRGKNVTAVASVQGHDYAWRGCHADLELAKKLALAACRKQAGCDCQIIFAEASKVDNTPRSCSRKRSRRSSRRLPG